MIKEYFVNSSEREDIKRVIKSVFESSRSRSDDDIKERAVLSMLDLPDNIVLEILKISRLGECGAVIFREILEESYFQVSTPCQRRSERTIDYDFELVPVLLGSIIGDLIGYSVQHNGRMINDIIPQIEYQYVDNSALGYKQKFNLHTEDAYHDFPPDFLTLFSIRNFEKAATLISELPDDINFLSDFSVLFDSLFKNPSNAGSGNIDSIIKSKPILFGVRNKPNIQLNTARPPYTKQSDVDLYLTNLISLLEQNVKNVILNSGDLIVINNLRCLHGRSPFEANMGIERRWLLRTLIRKDISRCNFELGSFTTIM